MPERLQLFKCEECASIVEVLHAGACEPVCCDKPMRLLVENAVDATKEKHLPVVEKAAHGVTVKVGSVPHPMEEKHYIEWVQVVADSKAYRQFLQPGAAPEATFCIEGAQIVARAYCNLHGLWRN